MIRAFYNRVTNSTWKKESVSMSVIERFGTGGGVQTPLVLYDDEDDMSYQEVTGTVSQGAHPGSYNGQDAYNDMLITEKRNELCTASIRTVHSDGSGFGFEAARLQGCNGSDFEGGVENEMSKVRRLTPNECAALQGYPRNWCDIGEWTDDAGKKHKESDAAKMRAIGNSIALPFWHWLLKRISAQYEREATLGSLFDGIGGFPYCWEKINGKGSAVWASEIEPFCIAVTRKHFPEEDENRSD